MSFYSISNSTGKETGNSYPQLHCITQAYAHSLSAWGFPNYAPKLNFEFYKSAKLTDVLSNASISANGFLINNKVKNIFDNFNLMNHKYYDANVVIPKTGEILNYFWLHLSEIELSKQLDYNNSIFYETEWAFRKKNIRIESYIHYEKLKREDINAKFGVKLDEIFITDAFDMNLDVFTFLPFSKKIYISNKLKCALEDNNVTGFSYEQATEIKF